MDQDGSLNISYNEWRDFLLLAPSDDIHELIKYWRHSTVSSNMPKNSDQDASYPHLASVWKICFSLCTKL